MSQVWKKTGFVLILLTQACGCNMDWKQDLMKNISCKLAVRIESELSEQALLTANVSSLTDEETSEAEIVSVKAADVPQETAFAEEMMSSAETVLSAEMIPEETVLSAEMIPEIDSIHIHMYEYHEVIQEALCGSDGIDAAKCSCGDIRYESIPATGNHDWKPVIQSVSYDPVIEMIHHDAITEQRYVVVQEAYDEIQTVDEWHRQCDQCKAIMDDWSNDQIDEHITSHMLSGEGSSWGDRITDSRQILNHHDAIGYYETIVIEDAFDEEIILQEAYTENNIIGYECSVCGIMK